MTLRRFVIEKEGLPDLPGMMLSTVEALRAIGGSASIQELDEKVVELEGLTEKEQSFVMARDETRPRVSYYLSWARTYLKRGGALENSARGVWTLTDKGQNLTAIGQAQEIYKLVNLEERERARLKRKQAKSEPVIEEIEAESSATILDGEEDWKSVLLAVLLQMKPDAFERLSQRLLREAVL